MAMDFWLLSKNMSKNVDQNISENLSGKSSQNFFDHAKCYCLIGYLSKHSILDGSFDL